MRQRFLLLAFIIIVIVIICYKLAPSAENEYQTEQVYTVPDRHAKITDPLLIIKVFYEVLCPDSKHFIVKQLYPAWIKLKDLNATHLIRIQLVPFGKASGKLRNGQYTFECQHGEEECRLNRYHSCLINDQAIPFEAKLDMIRCSISTPSRSGDCGLADCTNGNQFMYADGLLQEAELGNIEFVPTITVNKSTQNQFDLLKNFYGEIVSQLRIAS